MAFRWSRKVRQPQLAAPTGTVQQLQQQLAQTQLQLAQAQAELRVSKEKLTLFEQRGKTLVETQQHVSRTTKAQLLSALIEGFDILVKAYGCQPPSLKRGKQERGRPSTEEEAWGEGVRLAIIELSRILQKMGLGRLGRPGDPFDPRFHNAIGTQYRLDVPPDTIVAIHRPGYTLTDDGSVLRVPEVVVSTNHPALRVVK